MWDRPLLGSHRSIRLSSRQLGQANHPWGDQDEKDAHENGGNDPENAKYGELPSKFCLAGWTDGILWKHGYTLIR